MLVHENAFVRFEFSAPHLRMVVQSGSAPSDEEWSFTKTTLQQFYDAAEKSQTRLALCFDLRRMGTLPVSRYIDWSRLFLDNRARTERCVHATAIVTDSPLVRGAVNSFFLLYTPVRPFRMVATVEDGCVWLEEQMGGERV